jgi:hypothetical protein
VLSRRPGPRAECTLIAAPIIALLLASLSIRQSCHPCVTEVSLNKHR